MNDAVPISAGRRRRRSDAREAGAAGEGIGLLSTLGASGVHAGGCEPAAPVAFGENLSLTAAPGTHTLPASEIFTANDAPS
jgi:hypothetical protein